MNSKIEIDFEPTDILTVKNMKDEIKKRERELKEYIDKLRINYLPDGEGEKLCILTYRKAVEIDKEKRRFLEPRKYEMKEFVRLAFVSWRVNNSMDGLKIQFHSVSSDNKVGNQISLYELEDIYYDILDGYTVEDAKKLLKKLK